MSQKRRPRSQGRRPESQLSVFPSELGWFGLVGSQHSVTALTFGHDHPGDVHASLQAKELVSRRTSPLDWWPELQTRLQNYASGHTDDFADVTVNSTSATLFQAAVVAALRQVGFGETVSYGELAKLAGSPRAARAVGTVMARNLVPIIIPCHRVIAGGGRLGGYSAPSGPAMKQKLLTLEGAELISDRTYVDSG